MSTTLQNIYYQRKVGTAKACYVCNRPTQTVLATIKTEDFLYTCDSHLSDPGFATPIAAAGPSADDIRKVIAEYSAREARRTAAATPPAEKEKPKEDDKPKGWGATLLSGAGSVASAAASGVAALASPTSGSEGAASKPASPGPPSPGGPSTTGIPSVPAQTHNKYALHRSFFESRRAELRRREQTARAKEVSKDMPQVPRGF